MLHRRAAVVVELDGDRYHSTRQARDNDRERQTDLAAAGFMVIRFGWRDVADRPAWCRERLLRSVNARLARAGGT
jgi:very-short-patch-repair endonuclease